jgi:hypothetical protein
VIVETFFSTETFCSPGMKILRDKNSFRAVGWPRCLGIRASRGDQDGPGRAWSVPNATALAVTALALGALVPPAIAHEGANVLAKRDAADQIAIDR